MLKAMRLITKCTIEMILSWKHYGFNIYCGNRIPKIITNLWKTLQDTLSENLFSQERMKYIPEQSKVAYQSKHGKDKKEFDALD